MKAENVKITVDALKALLFIADGDMRQAINNLQACFYAAQGNFPFT
jgi:replication factor C subunit 2/4